MHSEFHEPSDVELYEVEYRLSTGIVKHEFLTYDPFFKVWRYLETDSSNRVVGAGVY